MPLLFALLLLGLVEGERRCEELAVGEWVCNLGSFFMLAWVTLPACAWPLVSFPVGCLSLASFSFLFPYHFVRCFWCLCCKLGGGSNVY